MGKLKILEVPNYDIHGRRGQGTREILQREPSKNPFQRKQIIKVTATYPQSPGQVVTNGKRVETAIYGGVTFMEAVMKAQVRFKGASCAYTTLGWTAPENTKAAQEAGG